MSTIREAIAQKARFTHEPLTPDELAEVSRMLDELGQHEAAAIERQRERQAHTEELQATKAEVATCRERLRIERWSIWDAFASSSLAGGRNVVEAQQQADDMMRTRKARVMP